MERIAKIVTPGGSEHHIKAKNRPTTPQTSGQGTNTPTTIKTRSRGNLQEPQKHYPIYKNSLTDVCTHGTVLQRPILHGPGTKQKACHPTNKTTLYIKVKNTNN